jgi:hypothetical protein
MIHPGLALLIGLQIKAWFRRTFRGLKRPQNLIILVIGLAACAGWVFMLMHPGVSGVRDPQRPGDPGRVRVFAPVSMAILTLLTSLASLRTRGVYFKPAEIDMLFPAPVSRRALLVYKISAQSVGIMLSAGMIGVLFGRHVPHRLFAVIGIALFFLFLTGFGYVLSLIASSTSERLFARVGSTGKTAFLLALGLLVAAVIVQVMRRPSDYQDASQALETPPVSWLLLPFQVFAHAITAPHLYPDFALYAGGGLGLCAVVLALVALLDVDYRETSVRASQWIQERLKRAQNGPSTMVHSNSPGAPRSLPGPVHLGGVGAIWWRQLVGLVRNLKALVVPLAATLLIAVSILISVPANRPLPALEQGLSSLVIITIFLTAWLRFDFRGDLDQMETLRSLPIPPWKLALGQMLTPVLALMLVQVIVVVGALLADRQVMNREQLLAFAAVLPLLDLLLIAVENLAFLLVPNRHAPGQPADIQFLGRAVLLFLMKALALALSAGLAAVCSRLVYALCESYALSALAAGGVLAIFDVVAVVLVGQAFVRFDLARDQPA